MERIRLDIIPKGLMPVCHASQYDAGRVIRLDLMDGLQGYSLTDEEIELNVRKPDGHIVTASVDVVEGQTYVDIVTTEQMCAVEGENICELKISKDNAEIYSLNFRMMVEKSVTEGGDTSESFIYNLRTQIAEGVAEEVATQYDSSNVIFDEEPTDNHGIGYAVTSEGIKTAIDNAFDYDNTASGSIVHITDGADNIPIKSLVSQIAAVETGNGQPKSPENPYTISGFDSEVVTRCGVNLFGGTYNNNYQLFIPKNTQFTISAEVVGSSNLRFAVFDKNEQQIDYWAVASIESGRNYRTFNLPYDVHFVKFYYADSAINFQIAFGTDTQYHAYNGNTYTFEFGQTVYGGHFDNKGNLVVTHMVVDMGDLSWSRNATYNVYYAYVSGKANGRGNLTCEIFRTVAKYYEDLLNEEISGALNNNAINVKDDRYTTVEDFKTAVTGVKLKYELETPIVLAITSQDIPTLLGENNIFSNTGDVEVDYYTNKSNDILEFVDSEIGKKNGTNIPIEANSQDSIKDYIDNVSLSGLPDTDISSPSAGQVLSFDGNNWVNSNTLSDRIGKFDTWKTSTTSFTDACASLGIYSAIGAVLDVLKDNISGYADMSINNRVDNRQGPAFGMIVFKANNNYFSGILLSYFASTPERQPIMYVYENGTYAVKRI